MQASCKIRGKNKQKDLTTLIKQHFSCISCQVELEQSICGEIRQAPSSGAEAAVDFTSYTFTV